MQVNCRLSEWFHFHSSLPPPCRRYLRSRRRGWWEPASPLEMWTTTRLSSESKPTLLTRTSSSSCLWRWRSHQVCFQVSRNFLSLNFHTLLSVLFFPCLTLSTFTLSSAAPGIYSSTEMLDFGTLRSQGIQSYKRSFILQFFFYLQTSLLTLFLFILCFRSSKTPESSSFKLRNKRCSNNSKYNCHYDSLLKALSRQLRWCHHVSALQSVRTTPSNEAVTIDFKAVTLKAGESRYTKVASISFDGEYVGIFNTPWKCFKTLSIISRMLNCYWHRNLLVWC